MNINPTDLYLDSVDSGEVLDNLTNTEMRFFVCLRRIINMSDTKQYSVTHSEISEIMRCCTATVGRVMRSLEKKDILSIRRTGRENCYRLIRGADD